MLWALASLSKKISETIFSTLFWSDNISVVLTQLGKVVSSSKSASVPGGELIFSSYKNNNKDNNKDNDSKDNNDSGSHQQSCSPTKAKMS